MLQRMVSQIRGRPLIGVKRNSNRCKLSPSGAERARRTAPRAAQRLGQSGDAPSCRQGHDFPIDAMYRPAPHTWV